MALASDINELIAPRAVFPTSSILSIGTRNKRRKLLLPSTAAAVKSKLPSKLRTRKRRRKLAALDDNRRTKKLLCKFQFQQYNRLARSKYPSIVPCTNESAKEGQSIRDIVPGNRRIIIDRCCEQSSPSSISANGLCSRSTSNDSRGRAASRCMPLMAMERPLRSQRDKTRPQMSQRKGSHLCLLQSRSLEPVMSARYVDNL